MGILQKKIVVLYDPPPPYGGVRVSAEKILSDLRNIGGVSYSHHYFDSNPMGLIRGLYEYLRKAHQSDGQLFQIGDVLTLIRKRGLLYWCAALITGKPKIFRGFAGGLEFQCQLLPRYKQWLLKKVLRSFDVVTFQTQADCKYFTKLLEKTASDIRWLPNTRELHDYELPVRTQARRFCFLGKVYRLKGAHHLVKAAFVLPPGVTIDIYGPMDPHEAEDIGINCLAPDAPVRYCGTVEPARVTEVLKNYDALLLPTTWKTEGHPGVILEAFSVGLPVIATRWNGIPELVDDTCGILIEPHSTEDLVRAIWSMHDNPQQWQGMRSGAIERLKKFDPEVWTGRLHKWIVEAVS